MITVRSDINGPPLTFHATVSGLAIYLDNFSMIRLAKGDVSRRKRFIASLNRGAELLFSVTNAAELSGPQGRSLAMLRDFLDEIGPRWFPVELDAVEVVKRETAGASPAECCLSAQFMKDYFTDRVTRCTPNSGEVIDLSEQFFKLGPALDWVCPQRDSICRGKADLDAALVQKIEAYNVEVEKSSQWLDQHFPILPFTPDRPATFTYVNLIRNLIVNAKAHRLKQGDGVDFCHAVMAASFASVATLDKHWKQRIESLPKPNGLARVYYEPELDRMVNDVEAWMIAGAPPLAFGSSRVGV